MSVVTKFAGTITQTTGGVYRTFENLNNLKASGTGTYCESSGVLKGKSAILNTRPSILTLKNFGFSIPSGALIKSITVRYRHSKVAGGNGKVCNIPAPTITLLNVSGASAKGVAPTTSLTTHEKTFKISPTVSKVNSSNFGVKFDYPKNANDYEGYMRLNFIQIRVEYVDAQYALGLIHTSGNYNKENVVMTCKIGDTGGTGHNPTVTITTPSGFNFQSSNGDGSLSQINATTFSWNPGISKSKHLCSIQLTFRPNITYPSGTTSYTGTFTASESYKSTVASKSVTVSDRPTSSSETVEDDETVIDRTTINKLRLAVDEVGTVLGLGDLSSITDFSWVAIFSPDLNWKNLKGYDDTGSLVISISNRNILWCADHDIDWNNMYFTVKYDSTGYTPLYVCTTKIVDNERVPDTVYSQLDIEIIPAEEDLTTPFCTIIEPTDEELDRLGNGYTYMVQSYLKAITTDDYPRDWYKNNRIGVFNNAIQANVYHTIHYENTEDRFDTIINLPHSFELSGCTLIMIPDKRMMIDNNLVDAGNTKSISLSDTYNVPVFFRRYGYSDVNITCTVEDSNSETVYAFDIVVKFYADATLDPYETIVDSTDYDNLTLQEIISNAAYWSPTVKDVNVYDNLECEFAYNRNYPLYLLIAGDYDEAEDYNYDMCTVRFTNPCVVEQTSEYKGFEPTGIYPVHIDDLVNNTGGISELLLGVNDESSTIILYDLPLGDDYGANDDIAVQGIAVKGTVEQSDELLLYATLVNPDGIIGQRSLLITEDTEDFQIGGLGDLWGFTATELTQLEDWEIQLKVINMWNNSDSSFNFGDLQAVFYVNNITKQEIICKIEDENIGYYGAFLEDLTIPEGLNTDTDYLRIDGTDTNKAYRQNIKEKTIEMIVNIGECIIKNSTDMLRHFTQLLVNDRDKYTQPIPKKIWFSHYPDVYFEYVLEDTLDIDTNISDYKVKVKLVIPAGTSYKIDPTVTGNIGFVQGLAAVSPVVTFKPEDTDITILETVNEKSFRMTCKSEWASKFIVLDCANQKAYLQEDLEDDDPINISKYVDINSDWFSLHGEFQLQGTNCTIYSVEYRERW